jgi:dihydroorotate dehydrogenase (fumarate)
MINLSTNYLGLTLRNPLIISSSGLTNAVEKIRKLEELGAGAVVLKSLFEEQINYEAGLYVENGLYPEALDYISNYSKSNSVEDYLKLIEEAKRTVHIPVIASINCISASEWVSFAKNIEEAGADALELNVFFIASDKEKKSEHYENLYNDLIIKINKVIKIPIAVKLGYHFTNLAGMVNNLYIRGAKGVVLFNRFYEPDIDIDNLKFTSSGIFSSPSDIRQSLRWVGILSDKVEKIDIAASTGIHDGKAVIKQILAGAKAVQLCSVLYQKGEKQIEIILNEIESWMKNKNYKNIGEFRGKMNYSNIPDPSIYERSQFMKYFSSFH